MHDFDLFSFLIGDPSHHKDDHRVDFFLRIEGSGTWELAFFEFPLDQLFDNVDNIRLVLSEHVRYALEHVDFTLSSG